MRHIPETGVSQPTEPPRWLTHLSDSVFKSPTEKGKKSEPDIIMQEYGLALNAFIYILNSSNIHFR